METRVGMTDDVLLRFLERGMLEVGGDDQKLEKLGLVAGDLAETLVAHPGEALRFAMVAVDPDVPATDPTVAQATSALRTRWPTYVNTFAGTPILLVRALLLDALGRAAADDDRIGVALVASARNLLPFADVGEEAGIWLELVARVESRVDARAEAEWATPASIALPRLALDLPGAASPRLAHKVVARPALTAALQAAAGPHGSNGATGGNPYNPSNQPQQWVTEFGTRAAAAVADVVDAVVSATTIEDVDVSGPLEDLADAMAGHLKDVMAAFSGATAGLQRRTDLLWWKEAAFSASIRRSYRDLPPGVAAALMAFDLHRQVPTFSPASVGAFLAEAVSSLPTAAPPEPRPIRELAIEACRSPELAPLRAVGAALLGAPRGRAPLLASISHGGVASMTEGEFRDAVGVPADSGLDPRGWAAWVFRELQAARAVEEAGRRP